MDTLEIGNDKLVRDKAEKVISKLEQPEFIEIISHNLYLYFDKLKNIVSKISISDEKKSKFIGTSKEFGELIKPLNEIKLTILRLCDGIFRHFRRRNNPIFLMNNYGNSSNIDV